MKYLPLRDDGITKSESKTSKLQVIAISPELRSKSFFNSVLTLAKLG